MPQVRQQERGAGGRSVFRGYIQKELRTIVVASAIGKYGRYNWNPKQSGVLLEGGKSLLSVHKIGIDLQGLFIGG